MKIKYSIDPADMFAFHQLYPDTFPRIPDHGHTSLVTPIASCIFTILIFSLFKKDTLSDALISVVITIPIVIITCLLLERINYMKYFPGFHDRCIRDFYTKTYLGKRVCSEHVMELFEDGINITANGSVAFHKSEEIMCIDVTQNYAFILYRSFPGFVIPKARMLEGNIDDFVNELRKQI